VTKNILLALALLVPMTSIAKTPSKPSVGKESPIPDCYPCSPTGNAKAAKPVVKESPIPDCYPCIGPSLQVAKATVKESPIPDCYPCGPKV